MIEKIIAFLQWIQGSNSLKKWVDKGFSFLILFVSATLIWTIYKEVIANCSRYSGCNELFPWDGVIQIIVGGFLTLTLVGSIIYSGWKKATSSDHSNSTMRVLLNTTLPFLVGLILLKLWNHYGDSSDSYGPGWYIYFFGGLYAISPIIHFLKENIHSENFFSRFLKYYSRYIVSFLIGLTIFIVLFGLFTFFAEVGYMYFSEIVLSLFIIFCIFGLGTWIILTYAWDEVKPIDDAGSRSIRKWSIGLATLFLFIWMSPDWKEVIIDGRIDRANSYLMKYGETEKGYKKAASVWGLKWAMKERYLENRLYEKELYAKIFDTSIESDIDDEIDVNKYRTRTSNGTSMLARGENAKVELNFAKHESEIKSDIGALETTVTYEFQNTDTQNQEVIYSIELPSSESVVTDLRLGLNLELTGTLAPRGAAEQVYVDSLRRNTDPALLEQTGPTTYRLRVFPVLSLNDSRTQGRQRVQFKYITPILSGENITVMPKTDILNLKLTKKSEIVTRVMEGTKALHQDSIKTDDLEDLIDGKKISVNIEGTLKDSTAYCAINKYEGLDIKLLSGSEKNLTKNIVFLDISKSAGTDKKVKKRYQELIDTWKNNGAALDIYTFNTSVTSAGYDLSDIEFWGNTDMSVVMSYIKNNSIENANIVILTDDESYERVSPEDKSIDYKKLKSNRISLIQIGDNIRTLKTEVTKSILATEGDVMRLDSESSIDASIVSLFSPKKSPTNCEPYTGNNTGALSAIEGGRDGKKVFGESYSGTGKYLKSTIYPNYVNDGTYYSEALPEDCKNGVNPSPSEGVKYRFSQECTPRDYANSEGNFVKLYISLQNQSGMLLVPERGYYIYSEGMLKKVQDGSAINIYGEKVIESGYNGLLEKIGEKSHIVNQSMSLIALENDQQRRDLERYSNQDDKYDTDYQNFNNTASPPNWEGGRRAFSEERSIATPVQTNIRDTRVPSSSNTVGMTRADSVVFSTNSYSNGLKFGSSSPKSGGLSIGSSSGSSGGGILQVVVIIIFFPLIAWYILRKKKSIAPEVEKKEEKPE